MFYLVSSLNLKLRAPFFVLTLSAFFLSSCTEALPRSIPDRELQSSYERSSAAASQARVYAAEARREREKAEALLEQVRELSEKTARVEASCAELVAKIPKPKPRRIYRAPKKKVEEKSEEEKKAVAPKFSPSDAPL